MQLQAMFLLPSTHFDSPAPMTWGTYLPTSLLS
jgi:hypothetical protein